MSKKLSIVLASFAAAVIIVLGIFSFVSYRNLEAYRLTSKYSSLLSFEETVSAVDRMSRSLEKSPYATDGAMCGKICSQVYADAMAAEAALGTLPFSTVELEEISGFLNQTGDYAYSLCSSASAVGFSDEDVEKLTELSTIASGLSETLRQLQSSVHNGDIILDSRERAIVNIGVDQNTVSVSDEFTRFEEEFPHRSSLSYDGRFNKLKSESTGRLSDAQILAMAARFAGVSPGDMKLSYEYEGDEGRKCYSVGEMRLCVDKRGVESMSRSRLVGESLISEEKAEKNARAFLDKQGFEDMELTERVFQGNVAYFRFCPVQGDVLLPERCLSVAVAMDDGSIYGFNREDYSEEEVEASWNVSQEQAVKSLPRSLALQDSRKVIIESEGGREMASYRLKCTNAEGREVTVYVDANSGLQSRIEL